MGPMGSAESAVFELQRLYNRQNNGNLHHDFTDVSGNSESVLLEEKDFLDKASAQALSLINDINEFVSESNWLPSKAVRAASSGDNWVYGAITRHAPPRKITRGFIQPVLRVYLASNVPPIVVCYLITMLPGNRDGLKREFHGPVGIHYHYIDVKTRRSDVIISFDTRWQSSPAGNQSGQANLRPLFWEKHAEGKARFKAKPSLWADEKRKSVYFVCQKDLDGPINDFRCAATNSEAVWPRNNCLTPHPSQTSGKPKKVDRRNNK